MVWSEEVCSERGKSGTMTAGGREGGRTGEAIPCDRMGIRAVRRLGRSPAPPHDALVQNPANLDVTAIARNLVTDIYRVTSTFPSEERFGLSVQMRRAVISIGSNIAEGCGRAGDSEFAQFLQVALGSASELEFQANAASDLGYLHPDEGPRLCQDITRMKRMLARLIKAVRRRAADRVAH